MNTLKQKIAEQALIKQSKIEISLAHQLGELLFDYFVGFSDKEKIELTKTACQKNIPITNVHKLHDFLEWVTPMLDNVNALRKAYDAECRDEAQKKVIQEASKGMTRAQLDKPLELHRSLGKNLNEFLDLAESYEKKYGPITRK